MAKNKHFYGFIVISMAFSLLMGGNGVNQAKSAVLSPDYRESSDQSATTDIKKSPKLLEKYYASQLETLGIQLRPGIFHRSDSRPTASTSSKCRATVYRTLSSLPEEHREQVKKLTLYYTKDGRRGLAGGNGSVILRCLNVTEAELASVLTHEVGHTVDATLLTGADKERPSGFYDFDKPVLDDDKSATFYRISWLSETLKKPSTIGLDFVSTYAATDPFEDFAETYAYYRLHGIEFRKLMESSESLKLKYQFMRDNVFNGEEFDVGNANAEIVATYRNYDVTVLPFPIKSFYVN